jgi:hypothetical protein
MASIAISHGEIYRSGLCYRLLPRRAFISVRHPFSGTVVDHQAHWDPRGARRQVGRSAP